MSLRKDQVEVDYGISCTPTTADSTGIEKLEYAICRTNSAIRVMIDLSVELEKHDYVSATMSRAAIEYLYKTKSRLLIKQSILKEEAKGSYVSTKVY